MEGEKASIASKSEMESSDNAEDPTEPATEVDDNEEESSGEEEEEGNDDDDDDEVPPDDGHPRLIQSASRSNR